MQLCHKKVKGFELKSHSRSDRIETIPDECAYMHSDIFHLWLVYITRQLLALSVRSDLKVTKSMNMNDAISTITHVHVIAMSMNCKLSVTCNPAFWLHAL